MTKKGNKSWFKKLIIIVGAFGILFVAVAIIVPLVVDVDQYRPEIVKVVNQNINGKLSLGKLRLSLWGRILIEIDGVSVADTKGDKLVSVDEAYFHLPFISVLSGSPRMIFVMNEPTVKIVKDKAGKLNLMSLVKEKAAAENAAGAQGNQASNTKSADSSSQAKSDPSSVALPAIATQARFGFKMTRALVMYKDEITALSNQVKDLNLELRNISMSDTTELEVWAQLDTRLAKKLNVHGPFRIEGNFTPKFQGAEFKSVKGDIKVDLDALKIDVPGTFEKSDSIPANLFAEFQATSNDVDVPKIEVRFHNVELNSAASIKKLAAPIVDFKIGSNEIGLQPWTELIVPLKGYQLAGSVKFDASAKGPSEKLDYAANLDFRNWEFSGGMLKAKPKVEGRIRVVTDQLKELLVQMSAPGNDLKISGNIRSFAKPDLRFAVVSKSMDLDQLVNFPPLPKEEEKAQQSKQSSAGGGKPGKAGGSAPAGEEDYDAMLDPVRSNEMLRVAKGLITVDMKMIKAREVRIDDFYVKTTLKNLVAAIEKFSMKVFDGSISSSLFVDLKPKQPTYRVSASVKKFDLRKAVESQFQLFKNTLYGVLNFSLKGNGRSFNPTTAKKQLDAKGSLKVTDAKFASIDIGRMTAEAINGSIDKIAKKVPQVGDKKLGKIPSRESRYKLISSDFSLRNARFSAPNFKGRAERGQGVDLDGNTSVNIVSYDLDAKWKIRDTYNTTKAKDLSVNVGGKTVNHVLAKGKPPVVSFPVSVGCNLNNPCYKYGEVPEYLAKVAASNVKGALTGAAKAKAKKQVMKQIEKHAPKPVQKKAKKLFKKFGF